ncbi:hypothetical protein ACFYRC_18055 [Streptomyces sp. NPDC005279]
MQKRGLDSVGPTAGGVWIPVQASIVAGFAALQWSALRATTTA